MPLYINDEGIERKVVELVHVEQKLTVWNHELNMLVDILVAVNKDTRDRRKEFDKLLEKVYYKPFDYDR